MPDTYQGKIGTISPAIGNYDINVFMNIDRYGETGPGETGPMADGTLIPTRYDFAYTGINGENFTNQKRGF